MIHLQDASQFKVYVLDHKTIHQASHQKWGVGEVLCLQLNCREAATAPLNLKFYDFWAYILKTHASIAKKILTLAKKRHITFEILHSQSLKHLLMQHNHLQGEMLQFQACFDGLKL